LARPEITTKVMWVSWKLYKRFVGMQMSEGLSFEL
jgi:hypothetical protein